MGPNHLLSQAAHSELETLLLGHPPPCLTPAVCRRLHLQNPQRCLKSCGWRVCKNATFWTKNNSSPGVAPGSRCLDTTWLLHRWSPSSQQSQRGDGLPLAARLWFLVQELNVKPRLINLQSTIKHLQTDLLLGLPKAFPCSLGRGRTRWRSSKLVGYQWFTLFTSLCT